MDSDRSRYKVFLVLLVPVMIFLALQFGGRARAAGVATSTVHSAHNLAMHVPTGPIGHQFGNVTAAPQITSILPIVADGGKNPELIPDRVAYRHFIRAVAAPTDPTAEQALRRRMMLGRVFALDSDQALVRTALQGVAESLDQISANRQKLNARDSVNWPTLDNLRVNEEQVLDAASARLMATLPASKASKLDNYVQEYVKRRIVLFGSLPTP